MAQRVPGMVPPEDTRRSFTRLKRRSEIPDAGRLQPAPLQPQARPVDTYARPEKIDNSTPLFQLAETLSGLNPSLTRFLTATTEDKKKDSRGDIYQYLNVTPEDQVMADLKAGTSPLNTAAEKEVVGQWLGSKRLAQLENQLNDGTIDPATFNYDDWFQQFAEEDYAIIGDDEFGKESYGKIIFEGKAKAQSIADKAAAERSQGTRNTMLFETWTNLSRSRQADGMAPADIVAEFMGQKKFNRDFMRLTFDQQNEMFLQLASQEFVNGNLDLADAILNHTTEDGGYKASLLTDAKTREQALRMSAAIAGEKEKRALGEAAKADEGLVRQEIRVALSEGRAMNLTARDVLTESGSVKELTPEAQQKMAKEEAYTMLNEFIQYNKLDPENPAHAKIIATEEAKLFTSNGLKNDAWFTEMEAGPASINPSTLSGDSLPPNYEAGFARYTQLRAQNQDYLWSNLSSKATTYWENVSAWREMGVDDLTAHKNSVVSVGPSTQDDRVRYNQTFQDVDAVKAGVLNDMQPWFGDEPLNAGAIEETVVRWATTMAYTGIDKKVALQKARERYVASHINVNGWVIPKAEGMPPTFQQDALDYLDDFVQREGAARNISLEEVVLVPAAGTRGGTGVYNIMNVNTYEVYDKAVTFRSLEEFKKKRSEKFRTDLSVDHNNNR